MSGGTAAAVGGGVACVLLVASVAWAVVAYRRLVRLREVAETSWARIDVQLKWRHDLIPTLVETVGGHARRERGALDAVVAARGVAMSAASGAGLADRACAENELTRTLGRLLAVAQTYPGLKADQNFAALRAGLATTENKIAYAWQLYNSSVKSLNIAVRTLPTNLIAGAAGVRSRDFFGAAGGEHGPVQVRS